MRGYLQFSFWISLVKIWISRIFSKPRKPTFELVGTVLKTTFKQTRIHCAKVQHYNHYNSWGHVTLTLYKPDTSLRLTAEAGPDGLRLRES